MEQKFEEEIFNLGFKKNDIDPCVFYKVEKHVFCLICIYVNDAIITGEEWMMEDTIKNLGST